MKSLCCVLILSISVAFTGCQKSIEIGPLFGPTHDYSKWITVSGKVIDNNSGKPIPGVTVSMYYFNGFSLLGCTTCFDGDTVTDNDGNYMFKFKTDRFGLEYTMICKSDLVLPYPYSNPSIPLYPTLYDKLTISDKAIFYKKDFVLQSISFTEINFNNIDGLNETINGYVMINGDTDMVSDFFYTKPWQYGPIRSEDLRYFLYSDYMDTISFKASVYRLGKPMVLIEKTFVAGPERTRKMILDYK